MIESSKNMGLFAKVCRLCTETACFELNLA